MLGHFKPRVRVGGIAFATAIMVVLVFGSCHSPVMGQVTGGTRLDELASPDQPVDFGRDVQPIFESYCYACHGPGRQESNYRLDVRNLAMAEGDFGDQPIIAGQGTESPLLRYMSGQEDDLLMPPSDEKERPSAQQIDLLRRWIDQGADWPDEFAGDASTKLTTDHWSFQPIANVKPPAVEPFSVPDSVPDSVPEFQLRNGIDRFIARGLSDQQLLPSPPAGRVAIIRRIYLDIHGLQPTPNQVKSFVEDASPDAYDRLVDDALASHHYGERWARHWLDVVRFAESTGYEVNRDRANAFYYRDYVIDALNNDKPYRDFVIEQLAGDAVGVDEATGFLVGGAHDIVKSPDVSLTLMQREDELADYVNTTSTAFLGLTVGCARCHNHKFDPILQKDYYSLQSVFAGVEHGERKLLSRAKPGVLDSINTARDGLRHSEAQLAKLRAAAPAISETDDLLAAVNPTLNIDSFDAVEATFIRFEIRNTNNQSEPCIDELEVFVVDDDTNVALESAGSIATSSGNYPNNAKHTLPHVNDGKYGNDFSWISNDKTNSWVAIELDQPQMIHRVEWGRDRTGNSADRLPVDYSIAVSNDGENWQEVAGSHRRKPFWENGKEPEDAFIARLTGDDSALADVVFKELERIRAEIKKQTESIPVGYVGNFKAPLPIHRLYRGDPLSPREIVFPDILTVMGTLAMDNDTPEQDRRLRLAHWIASADNPLTARVVVNRVWHYHFGTGLVATPSDFGKNGGLPSHPELLDWLARKFMENDWSLKWLHREILISSTYRQSSVPRKRGLATDADCRLLWRFPPRRLEAEAIRDCILQVSGQLNPKTGGPGFLLFKVDRENVHHYFPLEKFEPEHFRRMIYMTKIRQERDEVFGVFDCPDGGQTIPNRSRSTTALQALSLFNSDFMIEQAGFFAERLRREAGEDQSDQVKLAFALAFSRQPTLNELNDANALVSEHGLKAFCRAMLNASEFLFLS